MYTYGTWLLVSDLSRGPYRIDHVERIDFSSPTLRLAMHLTNPCNSILYSNSCKHLRAPTWLWECPVPR